MNPDILAWAPADGEDVQTRTARDPTSQARILRVLDQHPEGVLLARLIAGSGLDYQPAYQALRKLIRDGKVERLPGQKQHRRFRRSA